MSKQALIIVDHGSTVKEANELLIQIRNMVASHEKCGFDIVRHCHMEIAEPTISQAFDDCVLEGAESITVHPYFLVPGRHSKQDIPNMVKHAARKHPGIIYSITEPLGAHNKIIEVILDRAKEHID